MCNISSTEDGIDITLYDKKNEYKNNNMSVCPNNCTYIDYNYINKTVICQCKIQNGITLNDKKMLINIDISKSITNLKIVTCYKLLFSKEGLIKNIGSYIFLLILILYLILAFLFYSKGFDYLCNKINQILNIKNMEIENDKNCRKIHKDKKKFNKNLSDYSLKSKVDNNINSKINIDNQSNSDLNVSENALKNTKKEKDSEISINYTDYEINNIAYEEAIVDDKRTYLESYISLLKDKNILIFTFCSNNDYNSVFIKVCLLFFIISLFLVINALFFNDSMMHKIYEDKGNFNFSYIIPRVIYSTIICSIINYLVKLLFLSDKNILEIKYEMNKYNLRAKAISTVRCLIIKYICFFISNILLCVLFWYYISCFCAVYKNTQLYLIKNTIISFSISLIYSFIICLLSTILRILALKGPGKYLYKISQFLQLI